MEHVEQFEKISEKFGASFVTDTSATVQNIENKLAKISERKNDLIQVAQQPTEIVLKDQTYLMGELHMLISDTREVMEILKESLKQGTRASMFEAYSKLSNSVTDQLRELRELNKVIADLEMFKLTPQTQQTTVNITMTGADMLEQLIKARKESEINSIDVEYEVKDEDDE